MKNKYVIKALLFVLVFTAACSSDDDPVAMMVESDSVSNLFAPQSGGQNQGPVSGSFTKFDFSTGQETSSETDWDIAFRGTSIIVNGGDSLGTTDEPARNGNAAAYIAVGSFASINEIDTAQLEEDGTSGYAIPTGSGNGWYSYNPMANTIEPIPGRVLVFRTRDNRYAKIEILSYYKDAPESITPEIAANDLRYYSFNYSYQPNDGALSFTP